MPSTLLQQFLATDPRKLARFPEVPIDRALADWQRLASAPAAGPAPSAAAASPAVSAPPASTAVAAQPPSPAPATAPAAAAPEVAPSSEFGPAFAELATHVWRARNRLGSAPPEVARRSLRHLEAAIETLRQLEVTSKDWLNEPYDPGLPLKVISFQPTAGLVRDTIIEVVRPAVFWQNRLMQSGEVVVGRSPEES